MFCASCTRTIVGEPFLDGPYKLCKRCATEPVVVKDATAGRRGIVTLDGPMSPQTLRVREHRRQLKAEGLCVNGRKHGPAVPGHTLCASCAERERARNRSRKSTAA